MKNRNEQGTFTVWALCLCLILFLISGIAIDLWRAIDARRQLSEIADSASRSGASEIKVLEKQLYGNIVLDQDLAKNSVLENVEANATIQNIDVEIEKVEVDRANNEVTVELTSSYSFFLLGLLPGASDARIYVKSTSRPFEQ